LPNQSFSKILNYFNSRIVLFLRFTLEDNNIRCRVCFFYDLICLMKLSKHFIASTSYAVTVTSLVSHRAFHEMQSRNKPMIETLSRRSQLSLVLPNQFSSVPSWRQTSNPLNPSFVAGLLSVSMLSFWTPVFFLCI